MDLEIQLLTDGGRWCRPLFALDEKSDLIVNDNIFKDIIDDKINWIVPRMVNALSIQSHQWSMFPRRQFS